ncbi:MAG TPA: hypothetical protein VGR78_19460 [Verrucomicrobiae bacterium]|nr:hypothetical protein [Verrucomicrobiae bacterium]
MRVLFDQGTPLPLRKFLVGHDVQTTFRMGWAKLKNGDPIRAAENDFDLIITTDKNWKYQQRVLNRRIAIAVLPSANWPKLKLRVQELIPKINAAKAGDYIEL